MRCQVMPSMVTLAKIATTHTVKTPPRAGVSWVMRVTPSTATVVVGPRTGAVGGAVDGGRVRGTVDDGSVSSGASVTSGASVVAGASVDVVVALVVGGAVVGAAVVGVVVVELSGGMVGPLVGGS